MVTQKNPDENVNHLPSATSWIADGANANGDSVDNKRCVAWIVILHHRFDEVYINSANMIRCK